MKNLCCENIHCERVAERDISEKEKKREREINRKKEREIIRPISHPPTAGDLVKVHAPL